MRPTKLLNLLASNAKRGSFRAEDNTIYLYDVIVASDADAEWFGGVSAEAFVKALAGMTGDVALHINSPGGDVFAGVAMAQAIRAYDGKITAHVDGLAASAASAVAVACDDSIMAPGSMMMIHNAWTIALGDRHDFMDTAALLEKIDGDLAKAYAKRAGGEAAQFGHDGQGNVADGRGNRRTRARQQHRAREKRRKPRKIRPFGLRGGSGRAGEDRGRGPRRTTLRLSPLRSAVEDADDAESKPKPRCSSACATWRPPALNRCLSASRAKQSPKRPLGKVFRSVAMTPHSHRWSPLT
jgi:ATP-dependent protease ClpP protease subunit